jgi:hypothetical protein
MGKYDKETKGYDVMVITWRKNEQSLFFQMFLFDPLSFLPVKGRAPLT